MNVDLWNKLIDDFNVEGMAKSLESVGAGHYQSGAPRFTTEQVVAFITKITDMGSSVTWDVPVELDGTLPSRFSTS